MKLLKDIFDTVNSEAREIIDSLNGREGSTEPVPPKLKSVMGGAPLDILVIDVSPSMDWTDYPPTRLAGAKQAVNRFLDLALSSHASSFVGVVKFSARAKVVAHPMPVATESKKLKRTVDKLQSTPCTNIAGGLKLAAREIERAENPAKPRIILLTDGESNTGAEPVPVAKDIKRKGIQIDIIGIGGSPDEVNEPDLKQMASVIDGEHRYWFIKSVPDLVQKFETLALREV